MAWIVGSLRRLAHDRATSLGLASLALVTAFVFAVAPRMLDRVADQALRHEVAAAQPAARNLQLIEERRIVPRQAFDAVETVGERLDARLPEAVRELFRDRGYVIETPRWLVRSETLPRSTIRFRWQHDVERRLRIVDGRLPTGATGSMEVAVQGEPEPLELTVVEVALPTASAELLRVAVGDRIELLVDASDRLAIGHRDRLGVDVVGIYETLDDADDFWLGDLALSRPTTREISSENAFFDATALLAPDAYATLVDLTSVSQLPLRYTWRYYVDPERLDSRTIDALLVDVRRMETLFPTSVSVEGSSPTTVRSGLLRLIADQRARWASAEAVLTVVAIGPAGVAGATLALVALLAAQRGRSAFAVARGRGATGRQVVAAVVAQGVVLTAPVALLAVAAAVALIPGADDRPTVVAASAVALATTLLLLVAFLPTAMSEPGTRAREGGGLRRAAPRRLAVEAMVVGLAIVGMVLLRDRGIRVAGTGDEVGGADPFIAAVPALAGVAAGLVAIRAFPVPMRALAWLAAQRRDLVPSLAMRRVTRGAASAPVLLVLLGATTVGVFSATALAHLDHATQAVAWQETGAPFRLDAAVREFPQGFDPAALPGVERVARGFRGPVAVGERGSRLELLALDVEDYLAVVAGTPADPGLPIDLRGPPASPLPAIVSTSLARGSTPVRPGDLFDLSIGGRRRTFRAIEARDTFPTLPIDAGFAVVSRSQLEAVATDVHLPTTTAWLAARDADAAAIGEAVAERAPGVSLSARAGRATALRTAPVATAVTTGVAIAAGVAAAYAALAVALALALAGAARAVEVAHLRTLGLSRRESVSLVVVEHGPTVAAAVAAGVALGLTLFVLLRPGLAFDALVGSALAIPLSIDAAQIGLVLAAIIVVAAVGIGLAAALQRRATPATALRRGIE